MTIALNVGRLHAVEWISSVIAEPYYVTLRGGVGLRDGGRGSLPCGKIYVQIEGNVGYQTSKTCHLLGALSLPFLGALLFNSPP